MAEVDTSEKRFSMMNFGTGTHIHITFVADGTVDLPERQHLLDCYSGILFAPFGPALPKTRFNPMIASTGKMMGR